MIIYKCDRCGEEIPAKNDLMEVSVFAEVDAGYPIKMKKDVCCSCRDALVREIKEIFDNESVHEG